MGDSSKTVFEKGKSASGGLGVFAITLPAMAREMYKVPSVKQLYEKRKEFDLIIVNHMFNEVSNSFKCIRANPKLMKQGMVPPSLP